MTDRELLELAAKAAGMTLLGSADEKGVYPSGMCGAWNPLTDDGDALRLAVKLGMLLKVQEYGASVRVGVSRWWGMEAHLHGGIEAATRRAITRAAAEIGRAMS